MSIDVAETSSGAPPSRGVNGVAAGPAAAAGAGAAAGVEPVSVRTTSALGAVSVVVKAVLSPHSTTPRTVSTLNTPGYAHASTRSSHVNIGNDMLNQEGGRRNEEQQGKATSSCVRACVCSRLLTCVKTAVRSRLFTSPGASPTFNRVIPAHMQPYTPASEEAETFRAALRLIFA